MKHYFILFSCFLVNACGNLIFATANAPTLSYKGEIFNNIEYGQFARQTLDVYIPKHISNEPMPVVVFFHGGRWSQGDKSQYKFVGVHLSQLGYVVVLPNTRLYPDVKFPAFIEDAARAVAWVHNNIAQYQGNRNLFISGHSSGAHIGALLLADSSYLETNQLDPDIVRAFAGLAGPYDFKPETEDLRDMFGPPKNFPNMVVSNFIDGKEPAMLLITSADDTAVHIQNLNKLTSAINTKGGDVKNIIYPRGGHASTVAAFSWANPDDLPVAQDMHEFFQMHITAPD